ncbi:MAG: indole-3-glycerol phosphate synthase TrpC [Prevotella sp.]|jgi:indole-3-glycerol phosphate synthase|nr:indole-3-glycerol phosphate synthase TrpC [Prevotella sp.]
MADILEEIVAYKKNEVEQFKKELHQIYLEGRVEILQNALIPSMKNALMKSDTGIIAEFKRKSPSKGWINEAATADKVPISYQENGAAAISILTDYHYFGGSNAFIRTANATKVRIPILYKNFIVDEYQIYQAKICGASAILLIAACLTKEQCRQFIAKAHELELEVLLEMHNEEETEYAELEPDMYGINNRNLGTFETDVNNSFQLIERLPAEGVKVSESGISDPDTIRQLRACGYKGFLIGETFMKEADPGLALKNFIAQI